MAKKFVTMDVDGVLVDDITHEFTKRGLRLTGSVTSNAFTESLYTAIRLIRFGKASKSIDLSIGLDKETVDHLRDLRRSGVEAMFETANRNTTRAKIVGLLNPAGFFNPAVNNVKKGMKGRPRTDGTKPTALYEDDPIEALKAAKNGTEVVFKVRNYNGFVSWVFSHINPKIHRFRDLNQDALKIALGST